jgi:hypothetical protein
MNSSILLAVLATAMATAIATLLIPWFVRQTKARIAAQQEFAAAMKELSATVKVLADVPKMIAGHAAAAGAMALEVGKLREAVEQFSKLITKPEETKPGPDSSFVSYPNEGEADKAFLITTKWAEDPTQTYDQVKRAAEEELARRDSMPSVSME